MSGELKDKIEGLVLDMDGVLYRGDRALRGARELFPALRAAGLSFILLTNNSTLTPDDFSNKLARMGISVQPDLIMTSATATATYLQSNYPAGGGVSVLGEEGLIKAIQGIPNFRLDGWNPDFVVAGLFFGFDYNSLQRACSAIRGGARFIATNLDTTLPVEGGELWPGAGSIVAAVQTCSGVEPTVIGKPSPHGGRAALQVLDLPAGSVLCVGDRLETDIELGIQVGMPTALLLTGASQREDIAGSGIRPDYVFEDLPSLMSALGIE